MMEWVGNLQQYGAFINIGEDATAEDIQRAKRELADRVADTVLRTDNFIVKPPDGRLHLNWSVGVKFYLHGEG